jgi:hypothetical protein
MKRKHICILTILGALLNEEEDFIVAVVNENLAVNIAAQRVMRANNAGVIKQYSKYCGKLATECPTVHPSSFDDWLRSSISSNTLVGVSIVEKVLITYENVNEEI